MGDDESEYGDMEGRESVWGNKTEEEVDRKTSGDVIALPVL